MFIYRIKRNGVHHDYSIEYQCIDNALQWYKEKGSFLEQLSKRKLILFKNSLRYKEK